jgi:RNA polymerase sigma-70 factor, ECF subfamily
MSNIPSERLSDVSFPRADVGTASHGSSVIEREVIHLFQQFRSPVVRYTLSLGLSLHDGEEITQEVFVALFQHLQMGKCQRNLRGWIFRVAHNLALKRRHANQRLLEQSYSDSERAEQQPDTSPNPEEQVLSAQRQRRLHAVLEALPELDRACLRLRAEGLRYREIARVLDISLGAVSISLTRSLARLMCADER